MKPESRPGEIVIILAQQLQRLDTFFSAFSKNRKTLKFITENKVAIYLELSYRLQHGKKNESFGSFEHLLEQAEKYVKENTPDSSIKIVESGVKHAIAKLKGFHSIHKSISTVLEVSKEHGTDWIPSEFRRNASISLLALPIFVGIYEAFRAVMITAMFKLDVARLTELVVGLYVLTSVIGYIQEQRTLKQDGMVFNPYINLLILGLPAQLSSLLVRVPKHALEFSALFSALTAQANAGISVVSPVLGALLAATVWGSGDIAFNFAQEKIQKRQKNKGV